MRRIIELTPGFFPKVAGGRQASHLRVCGSLRATSRRALLRISRSTTVSPLGPSLSLRVGKPGIDRDMRSVRLTISAPVLPPTSPFHYSIQPNGVLICKNYTKIHWQPSRRSCFPPRGSKLFWAGFLAAVSDQFRLVHLQPTNR